MPCPLSCTPKQNCTSLGPDRTTYANASTALPLVLARIAFMTML